MRSVHPIRQSGPIPAYYGDYTMEDVRHHIYNTRAGFEAIPESTDVEELMRRVLFNNTGSWSYKKRSIKNSISRIFSA